LTHINAALSGTGNAVKMRCVRSSHARADLMDSPDICNGLAGRQHEFPLAAKQICLACLALGLSLGTARADTLGDCKQMRNAELRMRACSDVIKDPGYAADEKALAYRNRGEARADAGAGAQAVADFNEAVRLRPDEVAGYAGRARARLSVQDLDGAVADYSEALRLSPESAPHHVGRGHAHFVQGDTTAAIADFTEAIKLNPKSASTFNRRGLAYRRAGDLEHAIEDYTAAIAINPIYALAYNNRGYVYEAQGRKDDAIADFQTALLLDASLIGARDGLKRLGIPDAWLAETERRVQEGKALVQRNCSPCHAVGASGASPNHKAPEFRNLSSRHPTLALREPLSRGIAAPHDVMPKFALSGPEVDAVVAYINSLSAPKVASPRAKTVVPVADAVDIGDARRGFTYAEKNCSGCHNILRTDAASPNRQAPPFKKIANTPGMSITALTVWSRTAHQTMPNLVIAPNDMDDLIAYILGLRDPR
jgi:tetratricopeptide (TPR) repeat protein